jgi:serine/threonine protein kinase/WD40 repeat protein
MPAELPGSRCPSCLFALALDDSVQAEKIDSSTNQRWDDYELEEEIARGGMGVVYRARQLSLKRTVALKVILSGEYASQAEVQRFQAEAEAAAHLRHPNIVPIFESGEYNGRHYFSMEFVQGRNLSVLAKESLPSPRQAARYIEIIAGAIQYAHEQGVLHRDLKPSNILIDSADQPRITDFGLALRLDQDPELTATGQILGSPNFMPPEQAAGSGRKVGSWSDVYGIGAILYHLLTGRPPFQAAALHDLIKHLQESEPVAPRLLNPSVPRDLETICLKCLDKEPNRRYGTAREVAEELARFREDKPILARPLIAPFKAWRWCRRRPVVASLMAAVTLATTLGIGGVVYQLRRVQRGASDLRERVYASEMNLAGRALAEKNAGHALDLLRHHIPKNGETDLRGFEWRYLWSQCQGEEESSFTGHQAEVSCLAITPDQRWMLTGSFDHSLRLWDLANHKLEKVLRVFGQKLPLGAVAISADGALLAATDEQTLVVWETKSWSEIKQLSKAVCPVSFLDGGKTLVAAVPDKTELSAWNTSTWESTTWATNAYAALESNDRHYVALARAEHLRPAGIDLIDSREGTRISLEGSRTNMSRVDGMGFSPDGKWVAAGGFKGELCVWTLPEGRLATRSMVHNSFLSAMAFSPDSKLLATGAATEQYLQLWNVGTWTKAGELFGHKDGIWSVSFLADGRALSASRDWMVKIWPKWSGPKNSETVDAPFMAGFLPDGKNAVLMNGHNVQLWNCASGRGTNLFELTPGKLNLSAAISLNGKRMVFGASDGLLEVRDFPAGTLRKTFIAGHSPVFTARFAPEGNVLAAIATLNGRGTLLGKLTLWNTDSGTEMKEIPAALKGEATAVAFSGNGKFLAIARPDAVVCVFDRQSSREILQLKGHTWDVAGLAFAPDDQILASASWDRTVRLWEIPSGTLSATLAGHPLGASSPCFSPDGRTLAVSCMGSTLVLWSIAARQELIKLPWTGTFMGDVYFSPAGDTLATGVFSLSGMLGPLPDRVQFWRGPATNTR